MTPQTGSGLQIASKGDGNVNIWPIDIPATKLVVEYGKKLHRKERDYN